MLRRLRERINLLIYDSKTSVITSFRILNIFVSLFAFITIIYYYGFPQDEDSKSLIFLIIKSSFSFYILHYLIRLFYDFAPGKFIRDHWLEGIMMVVLIVEGISNIFFGTLLLEEAFERIGFYGFTEFSTFFIQLYFVVYVIIEITRTNKIIPFIKLHPATLFLFTFTMIIVFGTALLLLPEMTVNGISFVDALFTSTSATCVTGLSVVDPSSFFTFKGQFVILMLIKLGGLNIVGFVAFIILMSKFGIGVKYHSFMDDYAKRGTITSAMQMLRKILLWSIIFELSGAILFYFMLGNDNPLTPTEGDRVFASVFHSISAFNNAGFSTFPGGLANPHVVYNYMLHVDIFILIFFGSLGFMAMFDLFSVDNLKERMRKPWKRINFNTKVAVYFSIILVVFGSLMFFIYEYNNTLSNKNLGEKIITSIFHSISTRTAGFNTVDIGSLTVPCIIVFLFLMFIGASSNSTGGGIKTSTFAILWASTVATIRERKNVELFKRTIKRDTVLKAFTILLFFIAWNFIAILILTYSEGDILATHGRTSLDIIFEQVSAFGTVGLSTGITGSLSITGKIIITLSMFTGKIGALTLAYLFGKRSISTNYQYPNADAMVG